MSDRSRIALEEAARWTEQGLIAPEQLRRIEALYGSGAGAVAPRAPKASAAPAGNQLLVGLGVALFVIAVGTLVLTTYDDMDPLGRMAIVLASGAGLVGAGVLLGRRAGFERLGGALVATAAPLWVLSWVVGGEKFDATALEGLAISGVIAGPLVIGLLAWTKRPATVFFAHVSLPLAIVFVAAQFLEADIKAITWDVTAFIAATWVVVGILQANGATRRPWMPWVLGADAVGWILCAFLVSDAAFDLNNWGTAGLLALGGLAGLVHGIAGGMAPVSVGGAVTFVVAAIYLGASEGGPIGTVIALVAVGAALVGAGQLKPGWWRAATGR